MFCIECGKEIPDSAKFCSHCGLAQQGINPKEQGNNPKSKEQQRVISTSFSDSWGKSDKPKLHPVSKPINNETPSGTGKIIVVLFVIIGFLLILSNQSGDDVAQVLYSGCWSGAFNDGESIISIDGCGNASFDCVGGYCGINAQKQEDNSLELCVKIGSDQACTTAGYGVAQV